MKQTCSPERTPDVENWSNILNGVIAVHKDFSENHNDPEKLETFKAAWNKALEAANTTDELMELVHHVPIDKKHDYHSSAAEKLRVKWDALSDKEVAESHDNLAALKHAYENAPFDEHRQMAMEKLVAAITKKDAHLFHDKSEGGSNLAIAIEEKFPELFAKIEERKDGASEEDGGLYDIKEEEEKEGKKTKGLIRQIRKMLGLE